MSARDAYGIPAAFLAGYLFVSYLAALCAPELGIYSVALVDLACIAAGFSYCWRRKPELLQHAFDWKRVLCVIVLVVCVWFVSQFAAEAIVLAGDPAYEMYVGVSASAPLWLIVVLTCVIAPCAEETLFRGVLYGNLRERIAPIPAGIISASAFAFFHGTFAHIPMCLMLGLLLCWVYEWGGRTFPCVLAHAGFNTMTLALDGMYVQEFWLNPVVVTLLCAAMTLFLLFALRHADAPLTQLLRP